MLHKKIPEPHAIQDAVSHASDAAMDVSTPLILIVDDDQGARLILRYIMTQEGYDVVEADNGQACLDIFTRERPNMVLLDAAMPCMDGFDACAALRSLPGGAHTPVLMITGLEDSASVDRAFEVGASDYITKPIHYAVLRHRVRRLLRARRAELILRESEEQFRKVFDEAPIGMAITDLHGRALKVNKALCDMLGSAAHELTGRELPAIERAEEDDRHRALTARVVAGEIASYALEQRYRRKHHGILWARLTRAAMRDQDGNAIFRLDMIEDLTERKRVELLEEERLPDAARGARRRRRDV